MKNSARSPISLACGNVRPAPRPTVVQQVTQRIDVQQPDAELLVALGPPFEVDRCLSLWATATQVAHWEAPVATSTTSTSTVSRGSAFNQQGVASKLPATPRRCASVVHVRELAAEGSPTDLFASGFVGFHQLGHRNVRLSNGNGLLAQRQSSRAGTEPIFRVTRAEHVTCLPPRGSSPARRPWLGFESRRERRHQQLVGQR
jgi:hypothetical protein